MHAYYLFATLFPQFLRNWVDQKDKKNTTLATTILKNYISGPLFDREVDLIELNQADWKSNYNEFQVFIYRNARSMVAYYTKDDTALDIQLTVPKTYPLT